jgi:photosystem II stability/assembly factor-like uncharacterized protein
MHLLILTDTGLTSLELDGVRGVSTRLRETSSARAVAVDPNDPAHLVLGTRGDGAWRSHDAGVSWSRIGVPCDDVFSLAVGAADGSVYAGCEPSQLFVSHDRGASWTEREGLRELPSAPTWSFPPRPWTSHVRAIAPHPRIPDLLLVGIELGGLMRSEDGGRTWQDHRPGAHRDVHALAWHPSGDGRAYQAAGGGAARSDDHGASWTPADAGSELDYVWALGVVPDEPATWLVSASPDARHAHGDGPARAGLYRWRGDGPWRRVQEGLPEPLDDMPYALAVAEGRVVVGLRSGRLFASDDLAERWRELEVAGDPLQRVRAIVPVRRGP